MKYKIEKYKQIMSRIKVGCKVKKNLKAAVPVYGKKIFTITGIVPCKNKDIYKNNYGKSCRNCIGKIELDNKKPICHSYRNEFGLDIVEESFINFLTEEDMRV